MPIGQTLSTAISGLRVNATQAVVAADNIVNQNTPDFTAGRVRTVSVTTGGFGARGSGVRAEVVGAGLVEVAVEFTRLIEAGAAYKANAKVLSTVDELERETVDLIA